MRLILASGSPRRLAILRMLGLEPVVAASDAPERPHRPGEDAGAYAIDVARAKLRATRSDADDAVLAADTTVVLAGEVLGKPDGPEAAVAMLRRLQGRAHDVVTGVVVRRGNVERAAFERTRVVFRRISDEDLSAYVATGQPLDKAGAYGIQDRGAFLVRRVEGCFYNVMGLPVSRTLELLGEVGAVYDPVAGALVPRVGTGAPPRST